MAAQVGFRGNGYAVQWMAIKVTPAAQQLQQMIQSLVDYVLERGHKDYGEFAPREPDPSSAVYNHRKLLAYLFQEGQSDTPSEQKLERRISDLKLQQIPGQLNYFSQKIHAELSKKQLILDGDLYRVENEWLRKKMPDFYSYYFLKFAYANSYTRMHEIFLSEIENLAKEKDAYYVIRKTIEARESCLHNLRRLLLALKQLQIEESLLTIKEQRDSRRKAKVAHQHREYKQRGEEGGKSWKNELEVVFENISHLRKLTAYVVELIKLWKSSIYNLSDDPRRFRERVIFYHNDANYLLKMLFDCSFIRESILQHYLTFSKHFDPFLLRPAMQLDRKQHRSETEDAFLDLVKPNELDMDKITKALVVLAEEEYDEDQQSRFINERKNYGELENRKQFIERRRDSIGLKRIQSERALPANPANPSASIDSRPHKKSDPRPHQKPDPRPHQKSASLKEEIFAHDKRAGNTEKELQQIKAEKEELGKPSRVETSLNRLKQMRSIDLKKLSPYLNRNERIEKAQRVIELQHRFRVAQSEYVETVRSKKQEQAKAKLKNAVESNKEAISSKIFNRYIEENLKLMDQATKKSFLYRNQTQVTQRVASSLNFNKVPFHQRKEQEYERNLEKYYPREEAKGSPGKQGAEAKGTKAVIEISNKGVRANQKIIEFELTNKRGKNVGQILTQRQKEANKQLTRSRYQPQTGAQKGQPADLVNLFDSEKHPEVLIIRQQPQKLQQIKQFLYAKIKEELIEQMKKNAENKQIQLNSMIEEQKRKKLQEIIEERRREEERRRHQQELQRLANLESQRRKLNFHITVEPIQYAEENVDSFFSKVLAVEQHTYHRLFSCQKIENLRQAVSREFYYFFLVGYYQNEQSAYCIAHFDWQYDLHRKLVIDYLVPRHSHLFMSSLYRFSEYIWTHDPCQELEMVVFRNMENQQGSKLIDDLDSFVQKTGQAFEKQIYSNVCEVRYVWTRPQLHTSLDFPYRNYYFGKLLHFKAELLSASLSLSERHAPKIDMSLQIYTNYIFLLQELFRCYLTPEEVVQLRENSNNIRRLKDIFRVVLELEKSSPVVDELTVVEGVNLDDLYAKLKQKKLAPYDRYYWHHFYDKVPANRLLLSTLEMRPQLKYEVQSAMLMDRRFLRINCRQKLLVLRSSIYPQQNIYVLDTHMPKVKLFLTDAENYKLMRMELFVFLNLLFNNIVEDTQRFVNCIWMPQFAVCDGSQGKQVKRITDFSISMKKSFFLSEEIYFANHEYIKHAVSLLPKAADVIFRESLVLGFLHAEVEKASTGMPLYAKLVDKGEMF